MNQDVLEMIGTGKIPYRYEPDVESLVYFGFLVLVLVFVYAIAQALARKYIG